MKKVITSTWAKIVFLFIACMNTIYAFAQDNSGGAATTESHSSTTQTSTSTAPDAVASNWYASPWVWVAGIVVLILIIYAISRSSRTTTGTTATKQTTITRTDSTNLDA